MCEKLIPKTSMALSANYDPFGLYIEPDGSRELITVLFLVSFWKTIFVFLVY